MREIIEEQSINDINYQLLKEQFPNAVSVDEDGKYTIDSAKLQMSLDPSKANIREDGYGLNWVGKKELEYITIYSPNISSDKFTLELEGAVGSFGLRRDKLRFRG